MTTTWWPARQRLAALAALTATLTVAIAVALSGGHEYFAGAYVVIVVAALFSPAMITVQVIAGQVLVGSLLMGQDGFDPVLLAPVVAGVVATAELLAAVARLDTPLERHPSGSLNRAGSAALIGGGVFGAVVLVGGAPGPTGFLAVGLASGACVALAALLARNAV